MANGTGLLRAARTFMAVIVLGDFCLAGLEAFSRHHFVTAAAMVVFCAALGAGAMTAEIRKCEAAAQSAVSPHPKPDWPAIRRMEREVYGETFKHDGAPAIPEQGATVSTARAWHPDERACAGCGIVPGGFHYRGSATGALWCSGCAGQRATIAFAKASG
jgi:hypothetical protein